MGPVGEVEAGDLDGRGHADARQLARVAGEAPHERGPDAPGTQPVRAQLDDVGQDLGVGVRRMRRDAAGQVDRQLLARPLDAVPRGDPLRRRQADPPATEALHDQGAGVDGQVHGRRLVLAGAVEAHQPRRRCRRCGPRTTSARRPGGGRRPTGCRRCRRSRACRPAGDASRRAWQQGAVARGDALVGVGVTGVVQLGQQQRQQVVVVGQPDAVVVELVAQPQHPAPVGVELGRHRRHGPQPARRHGAPAASQDSRSLSAVAGRSRSPATPHRCTARRSRRRHRPGRPRGGARSSGQRGRGRRRSPSRCRSPAGARRWP